MRVAQQKLWRTIPPRHNHVGVLVGKVRRESIAPGTSETKVGDHDLALLIDEDVGGLDVSVYDAVLR